MLKDFLSVAEASERPSAAIAQAFALSRGYGIVPQFIAAVPGPPPLANIFGTDLVEMLIQKAKADAAETAEEVCKQIEGFSHRYGVNPKVIKDSRPLAESANAIQNLAKSYDFTIIERPYSFVNASSAIFEAVLFGSGTPVLLAPSDVEPAERFKTAVLAWDGSANATRAIAAAISLFPDLNEIYVLTIVGEKNLEELMPGAEIAAHIRRHGIQATVACVDLDVGDENAGPAISNFARTKSVDAVVMGAYGHSRLKQFILGGVTEYLSREATVPLFLMH
jgi:nucleotide-binding universal stress UspA family protein